MPPRVPCLCRTLCFRTCSALDLPLPPRPALYFARGLAWLDIRKHLDAERDLSDCLSFQPGNKAALVARAAARCAAGDMSLAAADCEAAQGLVGSCGRHCCSVTLAQVHWRTGRLQDAVDACTRCEHSHHGMRHCATGSAQLLAHRV